MLWVEHPTDGDAPCILGGGLWPALAEESACAPAAAAHAGGMTVLTTCSIPPSAA